MIEFDNETYLIDNIKKQFNTVNSSLIDSIIKKFEDDNNMNGWYDIDDIITQDELYDLKQTSLRIRNNSDIFLVIATGGSYLGTKGIIDALSPYIKNDRIETIFIGNTLSSEYLIEILDYIKTKNITVNIISKSGNTLEPNVTFDVIYDFMKNKYDSKQLEERIIITTTNNNNNLNKFAIDNNYKRYYIKENIGGRFSTLSVSGLLPMLVNNINIDQLLLGAKEAKKQKQYFKYSILRDLFYKNNKVIESFNVYEPKLLSYLEWVQQIFAETQGKKNKGILPIINLNTKNLHSIGQYYQEGKQIVFETNLFITNTNDLYISRYNKKMNEINNIACMSTAKAHMGNDISSLIIKINQLNEFNMGYLTFYFEMTSMIGAYLLNVDYYNQFGVENYKNIMNDNLNI